MHVKKVKCLMWTIIIFLAVSLIRKTRETTDNSDATNDEAPAIGNNFKVHTVLLYSQDNSSSLTDSKDNPEATKTEATVIGNKIPLHPVLTYSQDISSSFNDSNSVTHLPTNLVIEPGQSTELQEEFFQLRKLKVNPIDEPILLENRQLCTLNVEVPILLVIVPSIPSDSTMRNVIRKTIGSYVSGDFAKQLQMKQHVAMKLMFVAGNGPNKSVNALLQKENEIHRDIVQADFTDTYRNLTKKILIALKWTATYCNSVDYVIKIDTDVFVNIPILIQILKSMATNPNGTILGSIVKWSKAKRDGKWKVTEEEFPFKQYPPYASGNSYVISGHILPRLIHAAEYFPSIPIEDAFITGFLARLIGAKLVEVAGFSRWLNSPPVPCLFFENQKVTGTKVTAKLWQRLWNVQNDYHDNCVKLPR